ncbi:S8 family serine peptidase [Corallococcus aberystwythensis]|uniref:S8 family peptidase n=1 Tax=Corallococcus aberystwythensis TaxID=2316722 RepID=A0A3A8QHD5_9BACT|nr:S8 family serine peptidase [Corallococcus aberystwythensis]RKH68126.1 S8 family peptidase [Corallococcus aberystwythensis]
MKLKLTQAVSALSLLAAACGPMPEAPESDGEQIGQTAQMIRRTRAVPGEYIVVLRDASQEVRQLGPANIAQELVSLNGGRVLRTYEHTIRGFLANMSEAEAQRLLSDPRVAYVQENGLIHVSATQTSATWGIDRIDQRDLPRNSSYTYNVDGTGVHAYVIDTGIRQTHTEFTGRIGNGYDFIDNDSDPSDCHGHGTHVSGTVGGTTWGVAKKVTLHGVRVLDCTGYGNDAQVIGGIDWVAANHVKPAVANMSLGDVGIQAIDDATERLIAAGVTTVVAAGNDSANACNYSPARAANAITVGSTTSSDGRSSFSNYGTCVDIFAPGSSITSASNSGNSSSTSMSGTSMASPHVAGAAALYLGANPSATPAQVRDALVNNATPNKVTSPGTGSPNKLLYTLFITGGGGSDTTPPTTSITSPAGGATLSGTATLSANASDNVGVSRVEFYSGTTLLGTATAAPYSFAWNTTAVANGTYALTTKAYDAANNVGTSATVSVTVNNGTGSCSITEQLLLNAGFESGNTGWTTSSGVIDGTTSGSAPRTGTYKAYLNGYGSTRTEFAWQDVTIPATACSATLSFWTRITTAETTASTAYDKLAITVRNSAGTVLATLATYSNLDKGTAYVQRTFNLAAYKGQTVRIYFNGTEDSSLQTSFFIDDTELTVVR